MPYTDYYLEELTKYETDESGADAGNLRHALWELCLDISNEATGVITPCSYTGYIPLNYTGGYTRTAEIFRNTGEMLWPENTGTVSQLARGIASRNAAGVVLFAERFVTAPTTDTVDLSTTVLKEIQIDPTERPRIPALGLMLRKRNPVTVRA
ncbi:MAG: hypothetical protein AAF532_02260 [Planctomycetota bacterium]